MKLFLKNITSKCLTKKLQAKKDKE